MYKSGSKTHRVPCTTHHLLYVMGDMASEAEPESAAPGLMDQMVVQDTGTLLEKLTELEDKVRGSKMDVAMRLGLDGFASHIQNEYIGGPEAPVLDCPATFTETFGNIDGFEQTIFLLLPSRTQPDDELTSFDYHSCADVYNNCLGRIDAIKEAVEALGKKKRKKARSKSPPTLESLVALYTTEVAVVHDLCWDSENDLLRTIDDAMDAIDVLEELAIKNWDAQLVGGIEEAMRKIQNHIMHKIPAPKE